jgi:hypothetical protein
MAITIHTTPDKFSPAFNPVVFSITSDNYAQPDFKFVADVYNGSGSLLASLKYQPQVVGTDPVIIDVSRILYELVNSDYLNLNSVVNPSIVTTAGAAVSDYSVQFGEQYSNTVYANLASYSGYVFNAGINNLRFAFYNDVTIVNKQFLTRFNRQVARKRDSVMISMLQSDVTAISAFNLAIFDATGSSIYTNTINNPFTSLSSTSARLLHLHVGFDYLYNLLAFTGTIYNNSAYYTITTTGGTSFRIDLYSRCERFPGVRLHFLNEMGGFDSFNFMLDSKPSQTAERKQFLRQTSNRRTGYNSSARKFEALNRNYHSTYKEKVNATSDYLTDAEARLLGELLSSPLVYIEADAIQYGGTGMILIPVNITTMDYEIKKSQVDKLFNLEIDMEYTAENLRQVV